MKSINFIECTLRDGGYHNSWDFDRSLVEEYLSVCKNLEIKNIELGFRFPNSKEWLGEFAYTREATLESLSLGEDFNIGVMVNVSDFVQNNLLDLEIINNSFPLNSSSSRLNFVRIATHIKDLNHSIELAHNLINKGFKLAINIMQSHNLDEKTIEKFSSDTKGLELYSLYFADSLGCMIPSQINKLVSSLKKSTKFPIGIHAHNNMGLALANTVEAVDAGVEWVDMTMTGMGRGPGNTLTEDAIFYFSKLKTEKKVELITLLENYFYPLKNKHKWGSSPYYFLAGVNKVHPSYIQDLTKDLDFNVNDKVSLIDSLGSLDLENSQNSESYNPDFKEQYFNYYSLLNKEDTLNQKKLKNESFLIIGGGKTADKYSLEIEKFIKSLNLTVLQLNNHNKISEDLIDFRVSCHPHRLSSKLKTSNNKTPFIVPNLNKSIELDYPNILYYDIKLEKDKFLTKENYCILPNALALTYSLAIASKSSKAQNIYLVGFDGYDRLTNKNNELNSTFEIFKSFINCNILSLTPTNLNIETKSIYSFNF